MRRGVIIGIIGAVLLAVAWWFFLIAPRETKIDDAEQQLQAAQEEEVLLRTRIRALEEIRDAEVEYLAAMGRLDTLIPERPQLEEFIEQINQLSEDNGVLLRSLSPSLPTPIGEESPLREIAVSVQMEGQFFDVIGFLFDLTDLERLVRVDGIAVSSVTGESGETLLTVSLQVRLFTLADLVAAPDAETEPESETETESGGDEATDAGADAEEAAATTIREPGA